MPQSAAPESEADRLEAAADQAIAVCGGDVRAALKALIVANEYLESEVSELMKAVSRAYVRGEIPHLFRLIGMRSIAAGGHDLQRMSERRTAYIAALKAADNDDISPLMDFIGPRDDL
jgi:hypothetical protein